jgi:hypothetical protein
MGDGGQYLMAVPSLKMELVLLAGGSGGNLSQPVEAAMNLQADRVVPNQF